MHFMELDRFLVILTSFYNLFMSDIYVFSDQKPKKPLDYFAPVADVLNYMMPFSLFE